MSLPDDLLEQAWHLARREPGKPKQVSLRRAVSTAYYALFHLLTQEAARLLLGTVRRRRHLRQALRRTFHHREMYDAAVAFDKPHPPVKVQLLLDGSTIPDALRNVAQVFYELQEVRHEADYDVARRFTRSEALDLVGQAEQAFRDWRAIRSEPQAEAFMVALLTMRRLRA